MSEEREAVRAVAVGARTGSVGVSRIGRGILHTLDAIVRLACS